MFARGVTLFRVTDSAVHVILMLVTFTVVAWPGCWSCLHSSKRRVSTLGEHS